MDYVIELFWQEVNRLMAIRPIDNPPIF